MKENTIKQLEKAYQILEDVRTEITISNKTTSEEFKANLGFAQDNILIAQQELKESKK